MSNSKIEFKQFQPNWALPTEEHLLNCFTTTPKLSAPECESRVDRHLRRLMKPAQLETLVRTLAELPIENRIFEKLLEIVQSNMSFIHRKITREVPQSMTMLREFANTLHIIDGSYGTPGMREMFGMNIDVFEQLVTDNEQMIWAAMSNMKHLRYIAQMIVIPEKYFVADKALPYKDMYLRSMRASVEFARCCRFVRDLFDACLTNHLTRPCKSWLFPPLPEPENPNDPYVLPRPHLNTEQATQTPPEAPSTNNTQPAGSLNQSFRDEQSELDELKEKVAFWESGSHSSQEEDEDSFDESDEETEEVSEKSIEEGTEQEVEKLQPAFPEFDNSLHQKVKQVKREIDEIEIRIQRALSEVERHLEGFRKNNSSQLEEGDSEEGEVDAWEGEDNLDSESVGESEQSDDDLRSLDTVSEDEEAEDSENSSEFVGESERSDNGLYSLDAIPEDADEEVEENVPSSTESFEVSETAESDEEVGKKPLSEPVQQPKPLSRSEIFQRLMPKLRTPKMGLTKVPGRPDFGTPYPSRVPGYMRPTCGQHCPKSLPKTANGTQTPRLSKRSNKPSNIFQTTATLKATPKPVSGLKPEKLEQMWKDLLQVEVLPQHLLDMIHGVTDPESNNDREH